LLQQVWGVLLLLLQVLLWVLEAALGWLLVEVVGVDLELPALLFDCCNWCGERSCNNCNNHNSSAEDSSCLTKIGFFCKLIQNLPTVQLQLLTSPKKHLKKPHSIQDYDDASSYLETART
jgi:hypothetical protein